MVSVLCRSSQPAASLNQDVKRPHLKWYTMFQGQKSWDDSAEWLCLRSPKTFVLVTVCHYATIPGRNDSKEEGSFRLVVSEAVIEHGRAGCSHIQAGLLTW